MKKKDKEFVNYEKEQIKLNKSSDGIHYISGFLFENNNKKYKLVSVYKNGKKFIYTVKNLETKKHIDISYEKLLSLIKDNIDKVKKSITKNNNKNISNQADLFK